VFRGEYSEPIVMTGHNLFRRQESESRCDEAINHTVSVIISLRSKSLLDIVPTDVPSHSQPKNVTSIRNCRRVKIHRMRKIVEANILPPNFASPWSSDAPFGWGSRANSVEKKIWAYASNQYGTKPVGLWCLSYRHSYLCSGTIAHALYPVSPHRSIHSTLASPSARRTRLTR
jgi:hypothetical protein